MVSILLVKTKFQDLNKTKMEPPPLILRTSQMAHNWVQGRCRDMSSQIFWGKLFSGVF